MTSYHILVLDIGKTNKKLFVYDQNLRCLNPDEPGAQFAPVRWEGLLCDDMVAIHQWMMDGLRQAAAKYSDIRAVSISTHGATIALLGRGKDRFFPGDGGLVFPIISYENDPGPEAGETFFRDIGMTPEEAQRRTATPPFGWFLTHGRQIHYLKTHKPRRFAEVTNILMFPQYFVRLLTGVKAIEPTYVGCHGYLLDAGGARYSDVAEKLGVVDKLPPLPAAKTWDVAGTLTPEVAAATSLSADCVVTMGVHDSNAALVPYFAKGIEDFVVQDSGTWVVTMAPRRGGRAEFAPGELGREVFFNRSIYGDPVKTTIFRGGAEFDFYRAKVLDGKPRPASLDEALLAEIVHGRRAFCLPTIDRGSGLFPQSVARLEGIDLIFRDAATAWHVVDLGLAVQGYCAMDMAAGNDVKAIYIEGNIGRRNPVYRSVISSLYPDVPVRCGSMGGAPFGAAVLGAAAVENVRPEALADRFTMPLEEIPKLSLDLADLRAYVEAFCERVA